MPRITADQAKEQLFQITQTWTKAVGASKDYAFLDRHLADDWVYTDFNGLQRSKDDYRKLVDTIVSYSQDFQQFDVRLVGEDIAIVTGVYRAGAEVKSGAKLDNTIAFSAVWQLQEGLWRALLHHTTRIPPPSAP